MQKKRAGERNDFRRWDYKNYLMDIPEKMYSRHIIHHRKGKAMSFIEQKLKATPFIKQRFLLDHVKGNEDYCESTTIQSTTSRESN
jgi:hypothetical protein